MKKVYILLFALSLVQFLNGQNVGIGTTTPTESLHIVGNKTLFENNFVGIGGATPATAFTYFQVKKNVNSFVGMYIDAGATGQPFYGYALNGVAAAYHQLNGSTGKYEYFHSSPSIPDFQIGNTDAAFPNAGFLGLGTTNPTTAFTGLTMKKNVNTFFGMYIDAGTTGQPFYGYALNGVAAAYHQLNGSTGKYEYFHSSPSIPDFQIGNTDAAFPNAGFLGLGTTTPTTAFTGLTMKKNVNTFFGMYIDAGTTGQPFYGYALNGVAAAYHQLNGTTGKYEYFHSSPSIPDFQIGNTDAAFPNAGFLGLGTTNPTTAFTGLTMKKNVNTYFGMYIDAGTTGQPFYGYALNGVAAAYHQLNGTTGKYEYFHSSPSIPDFQIGNTDAAFPNAGFLGLGTTNPTTAFTGLTMKKNVNTFFGMYIDAGATGQPFYGYALNGVAAAYHQLNGSTGKYEYFHSSPAVPDFQIGNTDASFPNAAFLGIGTSTATNGATGFTLKKNIAGYFGSYIDAGIGGQPFYGYAISGTPIAWTELNSNTNVWEMNYFGPRISVTSAGNVGIGNSSPAAKLDVNGTIHAANLNGGATTLSTDASGNIIRTPSDARLKNNIQPIIDPLQKVLHMNGVTYNFIDEARFGSNRQMGFLAQELEKWVPEAVSSGGEYKSVNYQVLTALLAEAIKAQQQELEGQKKENDQLREELKALIKRVEALEKK